MILTNSDKERLVRTVEEPFHNLAEQVQGNSLTKAALRAFKDLYGEKLKTMEQQYADIYQMLPKGGILFYQRRSGTSALTLPPSLRPPIMEALIGVNSWQAPSQDDAVLTREKISPYVRADERETFDKADILTAKGRDVRRLLHLWLQPFTMPEQLEFSLPQLGFFLRKIDFRKRRAYGTWNDPPKLASQRRPKVINVPSDELKGLVTEAAILAQAVKQGDENNG